ncbi:MAG: prenyltransferase [Chloroflexi bacterium]|nr:prenyltransferase [Chloroflexota bacterium]
MPAAPALRYLLKLSRPRFWLYLAGPVLVAAAYAASRPADLAAWRLWLLFAYALLPANLLVYGVNDVFDAEIDAHNPKKLTREARFGGQPAVWWALGLSALASLAALAALPPPARPWLLGFVFLAVFYSAPPLRFKTRPFLDSLSNGLYVLPGLAAYVLLAGAAPPTAAIVGGWLWTMAMHSFSAIPDIAPDRAAGIQTTATWLGAGRTYAYCGLCWLGSALAFAAIHPALGWLLGVYPALVAWIALRGIDVERAYWWFPAINTLLGMALTLGGLGRLVGGA